jgi:hypothetical protein
MTMTINFRELGHDGSCDGEIQDAYCGADAVAVMLSATQPDGWSPGAPAASIAVMCHQHLADEPVAQLEHAEHNARDAEGPSRELWAALLGCYPKPIYLAS